MMLGPSLLARILDLTRWQVVLVIAALSAGAWLAELALRSRWSPSRRRLMESQLRSMLGSLLLSATLWLTAQALVSLRSPEWLVVGVGFVVIVALLDTGLRIARVFVFQWLFARSKREGVPVLLVDIFTLVVSAVLFGALLHAVFLIEVTSLLATSAVVSVVLGLALQDTLGQLLAGISLQLDRPFRLGDWVEVRAGAEHVSGQVLEVSWRATLLLAIGEELVTIPNKTMAQGFVLNFSGRDRPFVRGHVFRVPLDADIGLVKRLLTQAALETDGVVAEPAPVPLIIETTESWITLKMINFITDYGGQFSIGDAFQARALALLAESGIELAARRVRLLAE
jgi:small-conductance mechanosensitive channel